MKAPRGEDVYLPVGWFIFSFFAFFGNLTTTVASSLTYIILLLKNKV